MRKQALALGLAALMGMAAMTQPDSADAWWGGPYNGYPGYYGYPGYGYGPYGGYGPWGGYPGYGYGPYGGYGPWGGYNPYYDYNRGPGPNWMPWNW
ncbi:MAG: hypothetical protein HQM01_09870 [Magnetococcales bacterium]|nr:hypothetical protein [Magnetococcales bacterium]